MEKILVIDDDVQLSELIKEFLGNFKVFFSGIRACITAN